MKKNSGVIIVGGIIVIVLVTAFMSERDWNNDITFSTHLYPKFQSRGCTHCHDFFEKNLNGLSFTTHRERAFEKCVECHDREVTGFARPDEWIARPGLYTSDMNAQQTCETVIKVMSVSSGGKDKVAADLTKHLFGSPRVLWGISGATPNSGKLPKEQMETDLVQGGLEQWKTEVNAWIKAGMKCN
ncbi:MAG TPA: hypothetical protein HPP76_00405 [Desulfuromonadales bacterium]|nr:hypothetical protein [Desulfuromonadales bacterium]